MVQRIMKNSQQWVVMIKCVGEIYDRSVLGRTGRP